MRIFLPLLLITTVSLTSCAPIMLGTFASGASVLSDRRTVSIQAMDRSLQIEAQRTLHKHFSNDTNVEISVFNRKILLTGIVTTASRKQEIEDLLRREQNPREIINEITVTQALSKLSTQLSDASITSAVKTALIATRDVPSNSMRITTYAGIVYLMGLVTENEGKAAAHVASGVLGVQSVVKVFEYISEAARQQIEKKPDASNHLFYPQEKM